MTTPTPGKPYVGEPYDSEIEPLIGGRARVTVSGWGYWNVWLEVESYVHWKDKSDTALQPGECLRFATKLVVAAVVCWWKRLPGQVRGWPTSVRKIKEGRR